MVCESFGGMFVFSGFGCVGFDWPGCLFYVWFWYRWFDWLCALETAPGFTGAGLREFDLLGTTFCLLPFQDSFVGRSCWMECVS